jgi:uncharacterized protein with HEPN domain
MEDDAKALLFDIVESCQLIEEFVLQIEFDDYAESEMIRSAVERQFINIGEALNRLKQADIDIFESISDAGQIIGFRNVLVHGCDVVSHQLVWGIITEKLTELKVQCSDRLNRK